MMDGLLLDMFLTYRRQVAVPSLSSMPSLESVDHQLLDSRIETRTLIEAAYRRMRRDIVEGRLEAGKRLRVEHLKSIYQVRSGTLREAMALLVADALVQQEFQHGFNVSPVSLADLEDLTRMRMLLECEALRESIAAGKDDWEAGVVSAFHKLSLAEQRLRADPAAAFEAWETANSLFHEALVAACGSRRLRRMRWLLYQQAERYRRLSAVQAPSADDLHDEHTGIYEAVMRRDASRATELLTGHIKRSLQLIQQTGLLQMSIPQPVRRGRH